MKNNQRHTKALIGAIANCTVCGLEWSNYRSAQKEASAHARKTGHRVNAELTYHIEYFGKKP